MNQPRRAPNFARFLVTGAVVGFIAGAVLSYLGNPAPAYGEGAAVAFLGVLGAAVGAVLAGVVAVLLDRLLDRRR